MSWTGVVPPFTNFSRYLGPYERGVSSIGSLVAELLFDAHELIVLLDTFTTAGGARLQVTCAHADGEVGNKAVDRLATAVRNHGSPSGLPCQRDGSDGLGQGTDLVQLDEDGVGRVLVDAALDAFDIRDKQVVADQLDLLPDGLVQQLPAVPVVFGQAVLKDDEGVLLHPVGILATISAEVALRPSVRRLYKPSS